MNIELQGQFYGYTQTQARLLSGIASGEPTCFVVVGARFTGKSALLRHLRRFLRTLPLDGPDQTTPPHLALVDCAWCANQAELWAMLLAALPAEHAPMPNGQTDGQALLCALRQINGRGQRVALLLDNLDRLLAQLAQPAELVALLRRLAAHATLILTSEQPLYELNPLFSGATQLFLGQLEPAATQQWLADYQSRYPGLSTIREALLLLTGRHPFLLTKLDDSLREVTQMGVTGQPLQQSHLPLIRLRLLEHTHPLLASQWKTLQSPPSSLVALGLRSLLPPLQQTGVTPAQLTPDQLPALNWLINQALITLVESPHGFGYQLFSPLLCEFLAHHPLEAPPAALLNNLAAPARNDHALYDRLTKIEANLLHYFQSHSQTLIPTEQLLTDVWKRPNSSDRRVQEAIRRLRLQLEQHHPPIGEIKNERGRGYRFVPASPGVSPF
jgi:hypothetical protein